VSLPGDIKQLKMLNLADTKQGFEPLLTVQILNSSDSLVIMDHELNYLFKISQKSLPVIDDLFLYSCAENEPKNS